MRVKKGDLNPHGVGLAVGGVLGIWHLLWGGMVMLGMGQTLLDWVYWLHFLNNPFHVSAFDPVRTVMLAAVTFGFGYGFGWVFSYLWNSLKK